MARRPLYKLDLAETGPQDGPIAGARVTDEGEKRGLIGSDPEYLSSRDIPPVL